MAEKNLDFDKVTDRRNTNCLKYDFAVERGKPKDIQPLWVADMDFPTSSYVQEALQKQVAENKKTLDTLYPVLSSMAKKLSQGVKLRPEQLKYLQDLIATEKLKKQEQESCIMRMKQLQVILDESANARVEVTGEVFGGTKICIADVSMVVKNSMSYCKFIKQQGEVKMTAL